MVIISSLFNPSKQASYSILGYRKVQGRLETNSSKSARGSCAMTWLAPSLWGGDCGDRPEISLVFQRVGATDGWAQQVQASSTQC